MPSETPTSQDIAQRLIGRVASGDGAEASARAAHTAFELVYVELVRWVGVAGGAALLARALTDARRTHPVLVAVRAGVAPGERALVGVPGSMVVHGATPIAAGIEVLLVSLLDLFGRLVGDDLTMRLVDQAAPPTSPSSVPAEPTTP